MKKKKVPGEWNGMVAHVRVHATLACPHNSRYNSDNIVPESILKTGEQIRLSLPGVDPQALCGYKGLLTLTEKQQYDNTQ
eukprot:2319816-Amphidinium_carterae.1